MAEESSYEAKIWYVQKVLFELEISESEINENGYKNYRKTTLFSCSVTSATVEFIIKNRTSFFHFPNTKV